MSEQQEKAKFRQAIDHTLTGLEGNPFLYQRVTALAEKGDDLVKKRFVKTFVIVMLAVLCMSTVALAAVMLNYSPAVNALKQAREAVMKKYDLTHTTLGLFAYDLSQTDEGTVVEFRCDMCREDGRELAGRYTVTIPKKGNVAVAWTYDDVDPAVWQSGDMNAPVWGQPQLENFLRDRTNGGTVTYCVVMDEGVSSVATPTPVPVSDTGLEEIVMQTVTPVAGELDEAAARKLAGAALADSFDLTENDLEQMDIFRCELQQTSEGTARLWHVNAYLYHDGYDWNMYVVIDAATGEIVDIGMQTGGNG